MAELKMNDNALKVLTARYLHNDETPEGLFHRIAGSVASSEKDAVRAHWEEKYYEVLTSLKFLPNSPAIRNAGTDQGCLSACFCVSPDDSMDSIMSVAYDAAMIEKWGGGIGFGFTGLRPRNDKISTTHGVACGPVAVMKLYSKVGETLTQGAFRLGAHMGQLGIWHADVKEFIHCKDDDDTLSNFNISVQITDVFMEAVKQDADWNLINTRTGETIETVRARDLWQDICKSAWKTGDPGVVFMDRVWETAPNPQLGPIQTSNPCGEEFLENYGNCCLGSIDLSKHIDPETGDFDWAALEDTIRTGLRFLDDIIEVNSFPLPKLREVNLATRRVGLGVMGWADALILLKTAYDSEAGEAMAERVGKFLWDTAWDESAKLAEERGPFPEYEKSGLKERGMPPVRNSSVLTIAPTGTISLLAGCSSGIEPHFALAWTRKALWKDQEGTSITMIEAPTAVRRILAEKVGDQEGEAILREIAESAGPLEADNVLRAHGVDPTLLRTSMTISAQAHVKMQAAWQKYTSNSVSKTINMPNEATTEDISEAFFLAWETGCKAVTVYRDGSKSMQVLETGPSKEQSAPVEADLERLLSGIGEHPAPRQRPTAMVGRTERIRTGHGNMYITTNFDEGSNDPFELFSNLGKAGGCDSAQLEAISRLVSLALRSGISADDIVTQIRGITCCPTWDQGVLVRSAPDAVALALERAIKGTGPARHTHATQLNMLADRASEEPASSQRQTTINLAPVGASGTTQRQGYGGGLCPDCSESLVFQEGCSNCISCGYSKCE
ncbi:MAG: ribonucleoside-diphosphate reductase alpha chain [Chloroflexi bacterium]|jgi:ribonucleoside-diphosphate reductase alpha chain|nr:MAG: ribonucleoside-diphosphate reductase alpha chain [Chloroflexota bacterium]